jgi:hypothetical protein
MLSHEQAGVGGTGPSDSCRMSPISGLLSQVLRKVAPVRSAPLLLPASAVPLYR